MNKFLIKNTTKDERQNLINGSLAISTLDSPEPCPDDMKLFQQYIDGKLELDQIKKMLIEKYTEV